MFFALTDDQRALDEAVRDLLADRFPLAAVRRIVDDKDSDGDPAELWKAMVEQGWLAVLVPEEHDGLGLGLVDAAVMARRLGAGVVPGPWLATVVAGEALRLAGSPAQRAAWLPRLAGGEVRLAFGFRADGGAWDASGVGVTASGGALSGTATFVDYAHVADVLVVAAREPDGSVGLYIVDGRPSGVRIERLDTLDRTTRTCHVHLDGVVGERLAESSAAAFDAVLARATVLVANDLVGLAREALTRTVRYDIEREQFGKPVGSFQAIKHALADLHVGVTMAEHGALYAAHAVGEGLPDAEFATSVAKAKASDVARDVTAAMIQYHGGIGYTWEHDTHLFFKRAKREEYLYGDGAHHREKVAAFVVGR